MRGGGGRRQGNRIPRTDILQAAQQGFVNPGRRPIAHGKGKGGKRRVRRGNAAGNRTWLGIRGVPRVTNTCAISVRPTAQIHRGIANDNRRRRNHLTSGQQRGGSRISLGGGVAPKRLGMSNKLMVPLGHRNKGPAAGRNSGIRGETRTSTRARPLGDEGGRGRHLSDPILRADATCRRCIVLVRRSVQSEVVIKLPLTGGKSLNRGGKTPLAIINLDHRRNVHGILGSVLVNGRPGCRGDHGIRRHSRMKIRAHHTGAGRGEGLGGALGGVESGVKTQRGRAVDVAMRRGGVTSNATAASSHDAGANSFDGVEGTEVEVSNDSSNLRSKEKGFIATSRNMNKVKALVGPTRRGVRQLDSRDKTTAIRSGHPARHNLGARSRGGRARRRRGGNRVTHRKVHL